jgi:O-antigen/teichoic acid export membrane protein
MLSTILSSSDTWIINFILGPAAVAIYSLAMRFMGLIDMPLRSFVTTGMSDMAISFNAKNMHQVVYTFKKYTGMLTIAFVPFVIIAFICGSVAIKFLGGHNFDGGPVLMAINAFGLMLLLAISYPVDRFNGLALDIIHRTKTNFFKVILMLVVKITTGLLFTVIVRNIYGVVIGNFLMTFAGVIYGYYELRKNFNYTIPGIIATGYSELYAFIKKELVLKSRKKDNP